MNNASTILQNFFQNVLSLNKLSEPTCPIYRNLQIIVLMTALFKSADSKTIKGASPPSSKDTFLTVSAHCFRRI